jgi:predicted dehydrogenase
MRFGFAGVAHPHATGWANAATNNDGEIIALFDPVRSRAEQYSAKISGEVVDSLADLDRFDLDAVIVDSRCDEMRELALGALSLNLPILLEKPGGMTAGELEEIDAEAQRGGIATQLGYFLRYAQPVRDARQAISSGDLGEITLVRCHAAMPHRAWEPNLTGHWFGDPTNITSIFQEDACHVVDIMISLLGMPAEVTAVRIQGNFDPSPGEDAIATIWNYDTHLATIDFTAHEANPWIVEVFGTMGTLRFGLAPAWAEHYTPSTGWQRGGEQATGPSDGFANDFSTQDLYDITVEGLVDAIETGIPAPANTSYGLEVFRAVEAIVKAADTKSAVALDGVAPAQRSHIVPPGER